MPLPLKPGQGVLKPPEPERDSYVYQRGEAPEGATPPSEFPSAPEEETAEYVWRRGEGPNTRKEAYATKKNGIPVRRVSNYGDAFDQGLALALAYETNGDLETGKLHHVPGDRGGVTKYGIAQNYNPDVNVPELTLDDAVKIYREKYWPEADKLPDSAPDLKALYFEGYMNMGKGATKSLQRAIGIDPDGSWGPRSARALEKALDEHGEEKVIRDYLWQRAEYYRKIWRNDPTQEKFKQGWQNRVDDVGYFFDDVLKTLA